MALQSAITFGLNASQSAEASPGVASASVSFQNRSVWANGDGANEANRLYFNTITVGTSAQTLAFHDGSLDDGLGNALAMDRVRALYLRNTGGVAVALAGQYGTATAEAGIVGSGTLQPGEELLKAASGATDYTGNYQLTLSLVAGTETSSVEVVAIGVED